jgi:steroid 5-alpha reductase family enzyme
MEAGKGFDAFSVIGIVLMAVGILLEIGADWQKNEAKKKDAHMFVSTGLYSFVRCPNYLGELLLWTGVFISGLNIYHTVLEWGVALLGYIGIIYVMFSGARRLEIRQDKNYGHMPAYQTYVKTTPILLPFVPIYSVKKHTWLVA